MENLNKNKKIIEIIDLFKKTWKARIEKNRIIFKRDRGSKFPPAKIIILKYDGEVKLYVENYQMFISEMEVLTDLMKELENSTCVDIKELYA